jgi:hypothetical protein
MVLTVFLFWDLLSDIDACLPSIQSTSNVVHGQQSILSILMLEIEGFVGGRRHLIACLKACIIDPLKTGSIPYPYMYCNIPEFRVSLRSTSFLCSASHQITSGCTPLLGSDILTIYRAEVLIKRGFSL